MAKPKLPVFFRRFTSGFVQRLHSFKPVLTPVGSAVLVIGIILLIRSLLARNSYEIVLAFSVLLLLLVFFIIGIWKSRKLKLMEPGWKTPFPMTADISTGTADNSSDLQNHTLITGLDTSIPVFFRLHFIIRGKFYPSGTDADLNLKSGTIMNNGCSLTAETSVPRGNPSAPILLDFPMSGIFHGDGFCRLRDIFGFFSFPCGQPQYRTVNIRCAPCFGNNIQINAQTGAEDRKNKPAADVERYYMREYTPGDRFRDINWKSSEKIDTLITRISTDNQEKINRLEIHFRNYGKTNASLEALWLLDRAKARLSYFLRSLMQQNSAFIFDVRTAEGSREIETPDDLDAFLEDLAGISFLSPVNETVNLHNASHNGDIYIFSTACDTGLPGFILACNPRPVNLFIIQPEKNKPETETEILGISDFLQKGCNLPLKRLRNDVNRLNVQANKVEMYYAKFAFAGSPAVKSRQTEKNT